MKQKNRLLSILGSMMGLIVLVWVIQIMTGHKPYLDQWTRGLAEGLVTSALYDPFRWITNFGSAFFLVPFVMIAAILLFIWYRDWFVPLLFAGGTLLSHIINLLIKQLVMRERPTISVAANAEGHSFPSGHAMISLVCYGLIAYFITKKIKSQAAHYMIWIGFTMFIFLIGISRFVIHVHYLTDVISGFVIGSLFFSGFVWLDVFNEKKRHIRRT